MLHFNNYLGLNVCLGFSVIAIFRPRGESKSSFIHRGIIRIKVDKPLQPHLQRMEVRAVENELVFCASDLVLQGCQRLIRKEEEHCIGAEIHIKEVRLLELGIWAAYLLFQGIRDLNQLIINLNAPCLGE